MAEPGQSASLPRGTVRGASKAENSRSEREAWTHELGGTRKSPSGSGGTGAALQVEQAWAAGPGAGERGGAATGVGGRRLRAQLASVPER